MGKYGSIEERIRCKSLLNKVMSPEQTIPLFKDGMSLGWSGFTPAGYPKAVPIALAEHVEKNNLQGKLRFNLFIGASVGPETENRWAQNDMIDRRWPYQTGKDIAADTGLEHRPVADGQRVAGIYRRSVMLASGPYAMIDDSLSFCLVPWRPVIEQRLGQQIAATVRGGGVSWEIGRRPGLSRG